MTRETAVNLEPDGDDTYMWKNCGVIKRKAEPELGWLLSGCACVAGRGREPVRSLELFAPECRAEF